MRLVDLDPQFLRIDEPGKRYAHVDAMADADGISFLCPVCFKANNGPVGTHQILCWRPRVPLTETPGPGRWEWKGTGYGDLTLFAGSSSIHLSGPGCGAHFHVTDGKIV